MASLTQWTWVWASSGSWWWTGKPGILQSTGLQRVRHDWGTELTDSLWILMNSYVSQIHWFSVLIGHLNFICEGVVRNVNTIWHLFSLFRYMVDFPIGLHLQLHKFKEHYDRFQMLTKEQAWGQCCCTGNIPMNLGLMQGLHIPSLPAMLILVVPFLWSCPQQIVDRIFLQNSGFVLFCKPQSKDFLD